MEDDRAVSRLLHEVGGDAVAVEVAEALLALGVLAHARPDVGVEDVGAADRVAGIVGDVDGARLARDRQGWSSGS